MVDITTLTKEQVDQQLAVRFSGYVRVASFAIPKRLKSISRQSSFVPFIDEKVKTIGTDAFRDCAQIKKVSFPANLETIGSGAFAGCASLSSVGHQNVKTISDCAFQNCTQISSVSFPNAETIGVCVFQNCTSLLSADVSKLKTLTSNLFNGCSRLSSINCSSVTKIDNYVGSPFLGCTQLFAGLDYSQWNWISNITDIGYRAQNIFGNEFELATYLFNSLSSVGNNAVVFYNNIFVQSVAFPALSSIANSDLIFFNDCPNLVSVDFPALTGSRDEMQYYVRIFQGNNNKLRYLNLGNAEYAKGIIGGQLKSLTELSIAGMVDFNDLSWDVVPNLSNIVTKSTYYKFEKNTTNDGQSYIYNIDDAIVEGDGDARIIHYFFPTSDITVLALTSKYYDIATTVKNLPRNLKTIELSSTTLNRMTVDGHSAIESLSGVVDDCGLHGYINFINSPKLTSYIYPAGDYYYPYPCQLPSGFLCNNPKLETIQVTPQPCGVISRDNMIQYDIADIQNCTYPFMQTKWFDDQIESRGYVTYSGNLICVSSDAVSISDDNILQLGQYSLNHAHQLQELTCRNAYDIRCSMYNWPEEPPRYGYSLTSLCLPNAVSVWPTSFGCIYSLKKLNLGNSLSNMGNPDDASEENSPFYSCPVEELWVGGNQVFDPDLFDGDEYEKSEVLNYYALHSFDSTLKILHVGAPTTSIREGEFDTFTQLELIDLSETNFDPMLEYEYREAWCVADDVTIKFRDGSIAFLHDNGDNEEIQTLYYVEGIETPIPPPANAKTGHLSVGWYSSPDFSGPEVTSITPDLTGKVDFYMKWDPISYVVTYEGNGGTLTFGSKSVLYGSEYGDFPELSTDTQPARKISTVWNLDEELTVPISSTTKMVTASDHTVYADYWQIVDTITYVDDEMRQTTFGTQDIAIGQPYGQFPQVHREGIEDVRLSASWWIDDDGVQVKITPDTIVECSHDHMAYAKLSVVTPVTVTFNAMGGTVDYPTKVCYYEQPYHDLPSSFISEYTPFGAWYTDETFTTSVDCDTIVAVDVDHTLYAKYKYITFNITYQLYDGTIDEEYPTSFNYGYGVKLPTKVSKPEYAFIGWYLDDTFSGDPITEISPLTQSDVALYARWELARLYVTTLKCVDGTTKNKVIPDRILRFSDVDKPTKDSVDTTIEAITFGQTVSCLDDYALANLQSLTELELPSTISNIGAYSIAGCTALTSLSINYNSQLSGDFQTVFDNTNNVANAYVDTHKFDSSLFGFSKYQSIAGRPFMNIQRIAFGQSISSIQDYMFDGASFLSSVETKSDLTSIGYNAFNNCSELRDIQPLIDNCSQICSYAFNNCSKITDISLREGQVYGNNIFNQCTSLSNVQLNAGIHYLPDDMFRYCVSLSNIELPPSLFIIGSGAFSDSGITDINLEHVQKLNYAALAKTNISSVKLNDFCVIGERVFLMASQLLSVNIPSGNSVSSIEAWTFKDCTKLSNVVIMNNISSIKSDAFDGCYSLSSFKFPTGLTSIGDNAFRSTSLTSIDLPDSLAEIGARTFCNCISLTMVSIPYSVESIKNDAFYNTSIMSALIDSNHILSNNYTYMFSKLTDLSIGQYATVFNGISFAGSNELTAITVDDKNRTFKHTPEHDSIIDVTTSTLVMGLNLKSIDDNIVAIGKYAFASRRIPALSNLSDSLSSIDDGAFAYCNYLSTVELPSSLYSLGESVFRECTALSNVTLPNSISALPTLAFYKCSQLTSIDFGTSLTSIGDRALQETGIVDLIIPNTVSSIGVFALYGCPDLRNISIPASVIDCGGISLIYAWSAITRCHLNNLSIDYSVDTVSYRYSDVTTTYQFDPWNYIFNKVFLDSQSVRIDHLHVENSVRKISSFRQGYYKMINYPLSSVQTITFGKQLQTISIGSSSTPEAMTCLHSVEFNCRDIVLDDRVFMNCPALSSVTTVNGFKSIGMRTFGNCSNLSTIWLGDSLAKIDYYAFYNTGLTEISIPDTCTTIGTYAFSKCTTLSSVILSKNLMTISDWTFGRCYALTGIVIPDNCKYIGENAFVWCNLSTITFPTSIQEIGVAAFRGNSSLTEVDLSYSNLRKLDQYAFAACKNISAMYLPSSLTSVGTNAFLDCTNISVFVPDETTRQKCLNKGVSDDRVIISAYTYPDITVSQ